MLESGGEYPASQRVPSQPPKYQVLTYVLERRQKSAGKHYVEKAVLLNIVNMYSIFCSSLSEKTHFHF